MSPNFHRIHHQLDGPQDVNLGFALSIWDQMFHRAVFPTEETVRTDTGLPGRPLIVEQSTDAPATSFRPCRSAGGPVPPDASAGTSPITPRRSRSTQRFGQLVPWPSVFGSLTSGRGGGVMVTAAVATHRRSARTVAANRGQHAHRGLPPDCALLVARIGLAWIFIYYGAGKLFGCVQWSGHPWDRAYFSQTAHLHPGGLFAVLGGLIEFGGGIALALGLCSRLAGVALFGDMVMAMITVTWATGINIRSNPPGYQLNLALAVLALVVALLGSGRFSLDAFIERRVVAG